MKRKESSILINILGTIVILVYFSFATKYRWWGNQLLVPIIAAIIIGLYLRVATYIKLRILNKIEFKQFNLDNNLIKGKDIFVKYSLKNIFRTSPYLYLKQKSKGKGDWESYLPISSLNPYSSTGIYNYTTSGIGKGGQIRGGHKGDWGLHSIVINPEINVIHVSVIGKNRSAQDEYIIKPKY